jgi:O-antigen ligase
LIDLAIKNFDDWWLVGYGHTLTWAPKNWVGAFGMAIDSENIDITNHYLQEGLRGGLLQLGLFIAIITTCFRVIGRAVRAGVHAPLSPKLSWALGAGLAAHCMAFSSVTYFDQIQVFWFWFLAIISRLSSTRLESDRVAAKVYSPPALLNQSAA